MAHAASQPVALTIAGSDCGGGAGIQGDLKTFASLNVHGASAITCVTAQNPRSVGSIHAVPPRVVREQIEAVFSALPPAACKTGMLFSFPIMAEVKKFFRQNPVPLVIDPVMVATSGSRLVKAGTLPEMKELFRLATLITPNLPETEAILGRTIRSEEEMRRASKALTAQFGCATLVKGGHLRGSRVAADILFDGTNELLLTAPFIHGVQTHGTGCSYSAAITAYLALGLDLLKAVEQAKEYITQSIASHMRVGSYDLLNSFWRV